MKSKFKVIPLCLFIVFLFSGCGGGGGDDDNLFPELDETPLPGLFGIWGCTSTITSFVCDGESVDEGIGNQTVEEYRVYATEDGCALGGTKEDGEFLNTNWEIFRPGTTCRVGGDLLLLEFESVFEEHYEEDENENGCRGRDEVVTPLKLVGTKLIGDTLAIMERSRECSDEDVKKDSVCEAIVSIVCEAVAEEESEPEPESEPEVTPAPVPLKTVGLKLKLRIANYADIDSTSCPLVFSLCNSDGSCYKARFNEGEGAVLGRAGSYEFSFNDDSALSSSELLSNFIYPDDYVSMDLEMSECSYDSPNVYIEGVEVEAQFLGEESYTDVYRNRCLYRQVSSDQAWDHSPLGFNDDAWCFTIETGSNGTADDRVYVQLELNGSLDPAEIDWISHYYPGSTQAIMWSDDLMQIRLNHLVYNDWTVDAEDTYGFTFDAQGYGEEDNLTGGVKLGLEGTDGWRVDSFEAVYFKPGDPTFLSTSQCRKLEVNLGNIFLDGNTAGAPSSLPEDAPYYYVGEPQTCSELATITPIITLDIPPGGGFGGGDIPIDIIDF